MNKFAIAFVIATSLTACASKETPNLSVSRDVAIELQKEKTLASLKDPKRVRCEQTKRLGSHRVTTVCHTQEELAESRDKAKQHFLDNQRKNPSNNSQ